jgi:putative two-component system response regulator
MKGITVPNHKKTIVLVDDSPVNLLIGKNMLKDRYHVMTVPSGKKLFAALEVTRPDLILLDIDMPEMSGFQVITRLKADPRTAAIPVLFLSANNDLEHIRQAFSLGAADFIQKPCYPPILQNRVAAHILAASQAQQIRDYENQIQTLLQGSRNALGDLQNRLLKTVIDMVERRDEVSGGHAERTRQYMAVLLDVLVKNKVYEDVIASLQKDLFLQSTILYDLGKISVKDAILLKPEKLADNEYNEMKQHTLMGVKIIEDIKAGMHDHSVEHSILDYAKVFAGFHHEKWDGTGYPYGLTGYNIPLPGRLMAIADVYGALITNRPYKKPYTHEEAMAIIAQGKGTHFDPTLVDLFITVADQFRTIATAAGPCAGGAMHLDGVCGSAPTNGSGGPGQGSTLGPSGGPSQGVSLTTPR